MSSGINRLIQAKELKSQNANDVTSAEADSQRPVVNEKKSLVNIQRPFNEMARGKTVTGTESPQAKYTAAASNSAIAGEASVLRPEAYLKRYPNTSFAVVVKDLATVASNPTRYASGLRTFMEELKKLYKTKKDPEPQETQNKHPEAEKTQNIWGIVGAITLSHWELQDLNRKFDDSASLAVSTKKKMDDFSKLA